MNILKSSYLNLNNCKWVQNNWAVVLQDRGHQYDPLAKRINWIKFIEFSLWQSYSKREFEIHKFLTTVNLKSYYRLRNYAISRIRAYFIYEKRTCRTFSMNFTRFTMCMSIFIRNWYLICHVALWRRVFGWTRSWKTSVWNGWRKYMHLVKRVVNISVVSIESLWELRLTCYLVPPVSMHSMM